MNFLNRNAGVIALVAIVIAIGGYFYPQAVGNAFGAIKDTSYFDYFNAATGGAFQVNGTNVLSATSLALTMSNTATSTAIVGCVQTTATSTATPIVLQFAKSNTASTTFSGTSFGYVVWQFGTCPI